VISARQRDRVLTYSRFGREDGARLVTGGVAAKVPGHDMARVAVNAGARLDRLPIGIVSLPDFLAGRRRHVLRRLRSLYRRRRAGRVSAIQTKFSTSFRKTCNSSR
jgi:hypothetical protein